ncbi:TPA: hypothetical protein ACWWC1_001911, partial [Enterococcus faecium]
CMYIKKEPNKRKIILSITFFFDLIKRVDLIKDLPSDCRQTPKFGVLFAVFLFYTHCINYSGSDSNDEKTID